MTSDIHSDIHSDVHRETALAAADLLAVAPALERYMQCRLFGDVWKRAGLAPRDRSLVTVAALIARSQTIELPFHINLALDNGVSAGEISEVITHLAFYSGWANAMAAVTAARDIFAQRHIDRDELPAVSPSPLPLDEVAEANRASRVEQQLGAIVPGLVQYTTDVLFRDLWLRPGLAPRDRSLVTVSALIASGQSAQIPFHLTRAMHNGLTQTQAAEVITHLAFYAGWPNAMSAASVAKGVFESLQAEERHMNITRAGSQASGKAPAEYFTGTVRVDPLFQAAEPARVSGASVTFEPGARTAWHTHPLGQTLIVTAGSGRVQRWGGAIEEIRPGDVVWIPPGEKHWHGASPTTAMTHLAIQEQLDGKAVEWMEKVNDEQYQPVER